MQIHRFTDPQLFLDRCEEWLLQSEVKNSTILAIVHLVINGDHPFGTPIYMASIENEEGIVGCAVRAPPDSLVLANIQIDAMPLLVTDISTVYESLPGVTGMKHEAQAFAKLWMKQRGDTATINHWCWYVLEQVVAPSKPAPGTLRLADAADVDLVRSWAPRFANETNTMLDVADFYERRVRTDSLYLWFDEAPCTVVAVSAKTPNSIRISGVFTAPEFRRSGYASSAVASVSQLMLDAGHKFCVLFADGSDPSANRIYQEIGYGPIFNNVNISLSG